MSTKYDEILAAADAYTAAIIEVVVDDLIDIVRDASDTPGLSYIEQDIIKRLEQYKAAGKRNAA